MSSLNFIVENPELYNFRCNQNVLIKKQFFTNLSGYEEPEKPNCIAEVPESRGWYPYVNSYYQYGEDYDAVTRVPHILYEKKSQQSLSSRNSIDEEKKPTIKDSKDCYNESYAHRKFLRKKPTSFVLLGKPEIGEQELGSLLARHWQPVYIHPETLITDEINSGSRAGVCIEYNLRSGRAISVDVVMRLLQKRINHVSVQHRGFVICGFPLVANTLFSEDPVSSESAIFTVQDIFEEIFDTVLDQVPPTEVIKYVSRAESVEDEYEREEEIRGEIEAQPSVFQKRMSDSKSAICYESHVHADHKDQMKFLFSLCEDHNYIIVYLKCTNEEVINLRKNNRLDAASFRLSNLQHDKVHFGGFEMNEYSNVSVSTKLLKPQREFPANVNAQLDRYRFESQTIIEKYILLQNPEYVIKLDARLAPERMFHSLKLRLRVLPLSQSVIPELLVENFVDDEAVESPKYVAGVDYSNMTPSEWFEYLHKKKIVGPLFKWSLSDWEYFCPVSMYDGNTVEGNPEYAVHFMNKIYFLSNEDAFFKFRDNPRPYLLPPFPRRFSRVFIVGPPTSGKTSLSKVLSHVFEAVILDPESMIGNYLARKRTEILNVIKAKSVNDAVDILKRERLEKLDELEVEREDRIAECLVHIQKVVGRYLDCLEILNRDPIELEMTSLPMPSGLHKTAEYVECEKEIPEMEAEIIGFGLPIDDVNELNRLRLNQTLLLDYVPDDVMKSVTVVGESTWINMNHPFVQEYSTKAVQDAECSIIDETTGVGHIYSSFVHGIKAVEESGKSWIVDGFPPNIQLLEMFDRELIADTIIILKDTSDNMEFLKDRYWFEDENIIDDFRIFFKEYGYDELAHQFEIAIMKRSMLGRSYSIRDYPRKRIRTEVQEIYENECNTYGKDVAATVKYLEENGIKFLEFVITEKSIEDLAAEILDYLNAQFFETPTIFTPEARLQEVEDYGELRVDDEELGEEGDEKPDDQYFAENRRIGMTGKFCPFALNNFNVLWQGKEEIAAKYANELYFFSSTRSMDEFIKNPKLMLNRFKYKPPTDLPPPRICVVGTYKIGKTTLAKVLSKRFGLYYGDFDYLLRNHISDDGMLNDYFQSDQLLPDKYMKAILFPFWFEEPKKSVGFVLDGFPRRPSDVRFMCDNFLIPDIIIELTCPDYILHGRLLEILMNEWHIQMNIMQEKQKEENMRIYEEWKVLRKARLEELIVLKRDERYSAKKHSKEEVLKVTDQDKALRLDEEVNAGTLGVIKEADESEYEGEADDVHSLVSYTSVEEQADLMEIEMILEQELPEPGFHVNWETVQIATERIQHDVDEFTTRESGFLIPMKEQCDSELIPWISINANNDVSKIYNLSAKLVLPFKFRNPSMFERVYDISMELAESLLEQGYYFLSRFGKTCPVQMFEKDNYIQVFLAYETRFQLFPMIHKRYIYFIAGADNRLKFKENVMKYINQDYNELPMIQLRISIMGPPKCGKTTLAERIQYEFGLKHISIGKAVEYVLKYLSKSRLAEKVEKELRSGDYLEDKLAVACVEAMAFEEKSLASGYVMDGFPKNVNQIRELGKIDMIPHLILDLNTSLDYIFMYMDVNEKTHRPEYSKKFIGHRFKVWSECQGAHRKWIDKEYQNVARIPIDPSKWKFWKNARTLLLAVVSEIKFYYINKDEDFPLRIANMLVTPLEFSQRKGRFENYCPCCLFHDNALTRGNDPPDRTGLLQYKEYYYWLCNEHIGEFIDNPSAFLDPNVRHSLPIALPERIILHSEPSDCYEDGICVICLENNKPKRVFRDGSINYAIQYSDTIYLFDTEDCLNQFLRRPSKFCSVSINFRGTPFPSLQMTNLPTLGFLEQFDANQIVKAVTDVNSKRPFIPGLDIQTSALIYVGLYLKIRNPNTPTKYLNIYKSLLENMMAQRCDLIRCLEDLKETINPFLHYQEPVPGIQFGGFKRSLSTIDEGPSLVITSSFSRKSTSTSDMFPTLSDTSKETIVGTVMDEVLERVDY